MSILKLVAFVSFAATTLKTIHAEKRCPGNADSVPLRQLQGGLVIVHVTINSSGPFDFLIDTGAQITTVDSQLAAQLGLQPVGSAGVSGVATQQRRFAVQLTRVQIAARSVDNVLAVIEPMTQLHQADPGLRGILGEDFLTHFDFLIDNQHRSLCLDDPGVMATALQGSHLPLAQPYGPDRDQPFTRPLVIETQLAGRRTPILLRLDSGSNAAVLYARPAERTIAFNNAQILKRVVAGIEQSFAVLPPQPVAAGGHILGQIAFVEPMNSVGAQTQPREDGILPTAVFQRIFISYCNHFAILEPR
jgi:predicted aspartyl protease